MGSVVDWKTSPTLLGRLRDLSDDEAWRDFKHRYGPNIFSWCRRWGLQSADAEDVTQDVLLIMTKQLQNFSYDPVRSFRSWLKTVARNTWHDFKVKESKIVRGSGDRTFQDLLCSMAAGENFIAELDQELQCEVLYEAMAQIQTQVRPLSWQAFCLTTFEELSGKETAARLGLTVKAVYDAKSKIKKLLRQKTRELGGFDSA